MTPAHRRNQDFHDNDARDGSRRWPLVAAGATAVVVVAAGVVGLVASQSSSSASSALSSSQGSSGHGPSTGSASTSTTVAPVVPLTVTSVSPAPSATSVATNGAISVDFSAAPSAGSPMPTLSPPVAGSWAASGASFVFHPTGGYIPSSKVTVTVPGSTTAVEHGHTVSLGSPYVTSFTVKLGTYQRLQEMLSELGYLPFNFVPAAPTSTAAVVSNSSTGAPATSVTTTPTSGTTTSPSTTTLTPATTTPAPATALASEPTQADAVSTSPTPGTFTWAYPNIPASLSSQWVPGAANVLTRGAVMAFQADHGLTPDGIATAQVWQDLLTAVAARQMDPRPYNYIEVTKTLPQTLSVWQDGKIVYSTLANTGVPGANTADGTFPVDLRYTSTTMTGTNVNGSHYSDPGIPWVAYFNGGDAIHGYVRASYGFPQSNGCVELPPSHAGVVFNSGEDFYGTLVNVS